MNVVSLITVPVKNLWGSQYQVPSTRDYDRPMRITDILWGARFEIQEIV